MLDVKHKPAKNSTTPRVRPKANGATTEHIAFQLVNPPATATKEEDEANAATNDVLTSESGYGIIIEDDLPVGEGQVHRTEFMDHLAPLVESAAEQILSPAGRAGRDCPYLAFWINYYRQQSAAHIERAIALYAHPQRTDRQGLEDAILDHVRQAVQVWVDRREVQVPGSVDWRVDDDHVQDKPSDGAVAQRMGADGHGASAAPGSATAIRGQLTAGRPLDLSVRTRMERGFGTSFSDVRLHDNAHAASLAQSYQARAFTVGQDVAFAPGQYRPGTIIGDMLLAHELAHTLQQRNATVEGPESEAYEADASQAALGVLLPTRNQASRPSLTGPLALRRCGPTGSIPITLSTVGEKAQWITTTLSGDISRFASPSHQSFTRSRGEASVDMLATLTSDEFIDIQSQIDMAALLDALDDFQIVRLGTLGPLRNDLRAGVNRTRADFLYQSTRDRGATETQVVAHWMFSNMYGDDIRDVLNLLGADQHLYNTIDEMPQILDLLRARGVDRSAFHDRDWVAGDIARGLGHFGESVLGSSPAAKDAKGSHYAFQDLELPPEYAKAMQDTQMAELQAALTPGNIILGTLDYAAFNIPSTAVGAVTGFVEGIGDISQGHVESGTERLAGPIVLVVSLALGVRAFRRSARVAALLELTEEGQAALTRLRGSIGEAGINRVARYVQADSQAAIFVRRYGVVGIEALDQAGGRLVGAQARLAGSLESPSFVRAAERGVTVGGTTLTGAPPAPPTMQVGVRGTPVTLTPGTKYLYAVMEDGSIRIAEADVPFTTQVNGETVSVPRTAHPNLTGGGPARMSGELNYNPQAKSWIMDNNSGRYGGGRTATNLEAAADLLRGTGTNVKITTQFTQW